MSGTRSFSHRLSTLVARHRPGHRLLAIRRAPLPPDSRRSVERVTLALDGGREFDVVFKDLGGTGRVSWSGSAAPRRAVDPGREPWAYRTLLGPAGLDVPVCLGAVSDRMRCRHWLFLEPVDGVTLSGISHPSAWAAAARWLARFQVAMEGRPVCGGPMLRHDPSLHRWWFRRAVARARDEAADEDGGRGGAALEALEALRGLAQAHEAAAIAVLRQQPTVVHGDFGASNVLVQRGGEHRVRPVDWEMIGLGPRLFDLAALLADAPDRDAADGAVVAYRQEAQRGGLSDPGDRAFERDLAVCRLLRAVERCGRGDLDQVRVAASLVDAAAVC